MLRVDSTAPVTLDGPPGSLKSALSRLGPYELIARVGVGGMGDVYRARDTRLGRTVAVKLLRTEPAVTPERRRRFEREARAASALSHPNICTVYDVGCCEGVDFIVMEFLDGESLAAHLAKRRLSLTETLSYAVQIADGLDRAHQQDIVHRDLKPANVMLTGGVAKLLDFGIAKLKAVHDGANDSVTTVTDENTAIGSIVGTFHYMSPEQAQGVAIDHRSDIFSFGTMLYEMATGARPFDGGSGAAVVSSILRDTPLPVTEIDPDLPPELSRIVRRCLQKDPKDRYQSASDLRNDLADLSRECESHPGGTTRRRISALASRTRKSIAWGLAAPGLMLIVWASRSAWQRAEVPTAPVLIQVTAAPGWETYPALSADGSLVAYTSNESGNADIWVVGVGGGNAVNVSNDPATDEKPAWFPDGAAVAFASNRQGHWNIWKAPALGGGVSLLVPDARDPAISPDGQHIAFARLDPTGKPHVMVARLDDPSSARAITDSTVDPGGYGEHDPAWSPDGAEICYWSYRGLWIAPAAGGAARRLTKDLENDFEPAWSPDRDWIYFSSSRGGLYAIWRISRTGDKLERVTRGAGPERHPSVSRDGARVAFSTFTTNADNVLKNLRTGEERQFGTTRDETYPALSPDGSSLVYVLPPGAEGRGQLWIQALANGWPDGNARLFAEQPGSMVDPQFSPDGRWLAYQRSLDGRNQIWIMPAAGGGPVRFSDGRQDGQPAWSPDGTRIAFTATIQGSEHIVVAPVKDGRRTGEASQITDQHGDQSVPEWLDGDRIAYLMEDPPLTAIWEVSADGTKRPQRILAAAGIRYLHRDPLGRGLVVSQNDGSRSTLVLRLIDLRTRSLGSFRPTVDMSDGISPTFSFTRDGRFIAFSRGTSSGDIWVMDTHNRSKQ